MSNQNPYENTLGIAIQKLADASDGVDSETAVFYFDRARRKFNEASVETRDPQDRLNLLFAGRDAAHTGLLVLPDDDPYFDQYEFDFYEYIAEAQNRAISIVYGNTSER